MTGLELPRNVVLRTPRDTYTLRGRVDTRLCEVRPASREAVLGCRAHRLADGSLVEYRPLSADTLDALVALARERGFELAEGGGPDGCLVEAP